MRQRRCPRPSNQAVNFVSCGCIYHYYLVGGRAPTIVNVFPDIFRLRNWGSVDVSFIYASRAVPLLAICAVRFCSADEFSELDVDRVTFAITLLCRWASVMSRRDQQHTPSLRLSSILADRPPSIVPAAPGRSPSRGLSAGVGSGPLRLVRPRAHDYPVNPSEQRNVPVRLQEAQKPHRMPPAAKLRPPPAARIAQAGASGQAPSGGYDRLPCSIEDQTANKGSIPDF
jgi:hypothetical protein